MTDFTANPEALKDVSDGDAGQEHGHNHGHEHATGMGGAAGADLSGLRENMEVVGSDGGHVGVIDHVLEGQLKLNRQDVEAHDGQHHLVPIAWVSQVQGDRVMLNLSKEEAIGRWTPAG